MKDILDIININDNDMFSKLNKKDLYDLMELLNSYYISLRPNLGIKSNISFGVEIEFEAARRKRILTLLRERFPIGTWNFKSDITLYNGAEITSPILYDKLNTWNELGYVCAIIGSNAVVGNNTSGHIHVGVQALGSNKESWANFMKIWSVYENVIFRFLYGEFLTGRASIYEYAEPISAEFWDDYLKLKDSNLSLIKFINNNFYNRDKAVNFKNVKSVDSFAKKNTIEFRCPNGTFDAVIWQNNINFLTKLLDYCNKLVDNDKIDERNRVNKKFRTLSYDSIYLDQAVELSDMIFTNNLDKLNFLRQYLKSFQVGKNSLEKAHPFTKKLVV